MPPLRKSGAITKRADAVALEYEARRARHALAVARVNGSLWGDRPCPWSLVWATLPPNRDAHAIQIDQLSTEQEAVCGESPNPGHKWESSNRVGRCAACKALCAVAGDVVFVFGAIAGNEAAE